MLSGAINEIDFSFSLRSKKLAYPGPLTYLFNPIHVATFLFAIFCISPWRGCQRPKKKVQGPGQ
jgi:hypothetical protein